MKHKPISGRFPVVFLLVLWAALSSSAVPARSGPLRCVGGPKNLAACDPGNPDCPGGVCGGATAPVVGAGLVAFHDPALTRPVEGAMLDCETIYFVATLNYVAEPLKNVVGAAFEGGVWTLTLPGGALVDLTPPHGVPCIGGPNDGREPASRGGCVEAPTSLVSEPVAYKVDPAHVVNGSITAFEKYGDGDLGNPESARSLLGDVDSPGISTGLALRIKVVSCAGSSPEP